MVKLVCLYRGVFEVFERGECLGKIELSDNPYHGGNCYLKLDLVRYDCALAGELFAALAGYTRRPMQVMANSDKTELTAFLEAGGFVRKRRCFEEKVSAADFVGSMEEAELCAAGAGDVDHEACCRLLYEAYARTHAAINPWTAGYETFRRQLPGQVFFTRKDERKICHLAFVEENEIAYVAAVEAEGFSAFSSELARWLFQEYDEICFEADDCDPAAMLLRNLFTRKNEVSYDTYVREGTV